MKNAIIILVGVVIALLIVGGAIAVTTMDSDDNQNDDTDDYCRHDPAVSSDLMLQPSPGGWPPVRVLRCHCSYFYSPDRSFETRELHYEQRR